VFYIITRFYSCVINGVDVVNRLIVLQAPMYKTFYFRNLCMFLVNSSVCPWQELPALSNAQVAYPRVDYLKSTSFGLAPALLANSRLGSKDFPATSTLAYYEHL